MWSGIDRLRLRGGRRAGSRGGGRGWLGLGGSRVGLRRMERGGRDATLMLLLVVEEFVNRGVRYLFTRRCCARLVACFALDS